MKMNEEQIEFIEAHKDDDVGKLALLYGGKGRKGDCALEGEELRFALMQIEARQRLREKLPTILEKREFVFPTRISTEQASSEVTARLKGEIIEETKTKTKTKTGVSVDLTGGLGVDTIFMARCSERHHYVEVCAEHSAAAEVNLPVFLDNVVVHNTDAESFLRETDEQFDFVYADPARRSESNSKVFMLEDCVPNILELKPLIMSKSRWMIVKLSPMLDITQAIEKLGAERVIVVSVNDECKELIVVCGSSEGKGCMIEAVEINKRGRWEFGLWTEDKGHKTKVEGVRTGDARELGGDARQCVYTDYCEGLYGMPEVGDYLYEPYAAIMKVGHYEELAVRYGMKMVAPSSHLYFCNNDKYSLPGRTMDSTESEGVAPDYSDTAFQAERNSANFPGREFVVKEVNVFSKKSIREIKKANITVRNFPMSVAEVRRRFGIADGGDDYLFLTTDSRGEKLILRCEKSR